MLRSISFLNIFLVLASSVQGSNVASDAKRQIAPETSLFTILPKPGADQSATADFIKSVVGVDDLMPWTDVSGSLMSWTVQASEDEVAKLQVYTGVGEVKKLDLPTPLSAAEATNIAARGPAPEAITRDSVPATSQQEIDVQQSLVFPKDGNNKDLCDATEIFLKNLVQGPITPKVWKGELQYWVLNMTSSQRDEAAKNPGVSAVDLDEEFTLCGLVASRSSPTTAASLSDAKAKRDLGYSTQTDAVSEPR